MHPTVAAERTVGGEQDVPRTCARRRSHSQPPRPKLPRAHKTIGETYTIPIFGGHSRISPTSRDAAVHSRLLRIRSIYTSKCKCKNLLVRVHPLRGCRHVRCRYSSHVRLSHTVWQRVLFVCQTGRVAQGIPDGFSPAASISSVSSACLLRMGSVAKPRLGVL